METNQKTNYLTKVVKTLSFSNKNDMKEHAVFDVDFGLYKEEHFHEMVIHERKRSERSGKSIALIMIDISRLFGCMPEKEIIKRCSEFLEKTTRSIDIKGWYRDRQSIGIVYTELQSSGIQAILRKNHDVLSTLFEEKFSKLITISHALFPENCEGNKDGDCGTDCLRFYVENHKNSSIEKISAIVKRSMDIAGSALLILLFAPLIIVIALAIKLSSRGPVFFTQQRVGQGGKHFTFLKFRSMHTGNDSALHRDYVLSFMKNGKQADEKNGNAVYKITKDPRVTPVGKIIRRTSLDELPQLFNVLTSSMSLVGPRPPLPYEMQNYHLWQLARILEIKPGLTGFWQVEGRSSTTFETMVRMDLQYIQKRSLLLDLKLICMTPVAMFKGAY